ncbi:MAG: imidazole glycerol phosphate synthase subunit HisH [Fermentimonas sp.]|nr:imidazole glycerol phosphate synthase subunit HisH [Fermentimonas sp.]
MIAIIDYNAGNITSVKNALDRLGYESILTNRYNEIMSADKVIFPGVGNASSAIKYLIDKGLDKIIKSLVQPTLGICLGLQLLCQHSEEGDVECLGIFNTDVKLFPPNDIVPHMGWNNISELSSPLFHGINENDSFYFIHSYFAGVCKHTIAQCNYISPFSAAICRDNFYATQFHPEKSGDVGDKILKNFLEL